MTPTGSFASNPTTIVWFGRRIADEFSVPGTHRILDVGCGDGTLLLDLAPRLPHPSLAGVDYSHENMLVAHDRVATSPHRDRIRLHEGDYLTVHDGTFDLIIAQSSLQDIPVPVGTLAAKLVQDLAPTGRVVFTMPSRCLYNVVLNGFRRLLRACRSPFTDRAILSVASRLHPEHSTAFLRDRVEYMYFVVRHHEASMRTTLERLGLRTIAIEPMPQTSWGQPRHNLTVMSR